MSTTTITLSVKERTQATAEGASLTSFEGTVSVPGLRPTKLAQKDGATTFTNRGTLVSAAKRLATRLSATLEVAQPALKKAAKKSVKAKTAPATTT